MYTPSRQLFFPVPLIDDADRLLFGSGKTVLRVTRQRTLFALDNAGCKLAHFFCLHSTLVLKAFFFFEDYWRVMSNIFSALEQLGLAHVNGRMSCFI
jgi:hypothetical protein